MLRSLLAKFKREKSPSDNNKEEKKKILKEWSSKIGLNWSDVENLLFWKDPRVSLAVFIIATGFFWKFISYKLQRLGLVIIAAAVPCSFPETRTYIWRYCNEKFQLRFNPERRNLGFDVNDLYDCVVDFWVKSEQHYVYLLNLKHTSIAKFYLITASYLTLLIIILTCLPLAGMIYLTGTIFYFYPIINYLDLCNFFAKRVEKLTKPFFMHWSFSQTKRRRDRTRKPVKRSRHRSSLSDIETEEYLPPNKESASVLAEDILEGRSDQNSSENDEFDEFQLRGDFVRRTDDHSDGNEEDPFLPSYNHNIPDEMPSLSAFDSMMEPLDDEFHRGLDFRNITVASNNNSNNLGLPDDYVDEDVTSEDIDDIPFEDEVRKISTERHFHASRDKKNPTDEEIGDVYDYEDSDSVEFDVDQEFEFLDRTELYDVTDEEIMEQNIGGHSHSESVVPGSNILGY